ncbi:hypothetical protein [Celeribacter halophilus]|uniref:hypothetical protein n=1 Tax=Celeribacter halophilus TaxID=576117 RepID=UPI00111428D8|nr:hypothetical protein [Celeribacter halophilus]
MKQTFASISGQRGSGWKAWVVGHRSQSLPDLPENFEFISVDFGPEPLLFSAKTRAEHHHAVRLDKGRRVFAAFRGMKRSDVLMVVDDDDFISSHLADFVSSNEIQSGYHIKFGYIWDVEKNVILPSNDFHSLCGTSLLTSVDYLCGQGMGITCDNERLITELGSHISVVQRALREKLPFRSIPFPGAVYRSGSLNSDSKNVAATKQGASQAAAKRVGKLKQLERDLRRAKRKLEVFTSIESSQRKIPYQEFEADFLGGITVPELKMLCDFKKRLPLSFPNGPIAGFPRRRQA